MTCRYPYSGGVRVLVDQAAQDEQHGVHVQEVGGENSAGLGVQELPPGRPARRGAGSMPAACRIFHTVDGTTAMPSFVSSPWMRRYPHSGFSFARRTTRRAVPGDARGRPGLRRLLVSYFLAAILRCQASSVASVTGDDIGPAPAGYEPCQRGEPHPVGRLVPHPASMAAQHCVLVPEHQQFSILRQVLTEYQDSQAE